MFDPMTILLVGGGALAWRELNKKDYGELTPSRDERYRNAMEHCHQPELLLQEAKLFAEHGLKAQAAMLKRRAEWRARPEELREQHEAIYQKALNSKNIPAILDVAQSFEGWTATKKAATLRERVTKLQEAAIHEAALKAEQDVHSASNGAAKPAENGTGNGASIPQNTQVMDTRRDDT
jgi:hypothetical protein